MTIDYRNLLMVTAEDDRDINGMIIINQSSANWLMGKLDTGTYLDTLDHYGIDPYGFIQPVESLAYDHIYSDLLLP